MSSQQRQISYQSLKTVMEHLESNKRYSIASQCPDLRAAHRSTPLRIRDLELGQSSFTADGVTHHFGIIVKPSSDSDSLPMDFQKRNEEERGARFDVDEYGNEEENLELQGSDIAFEEHAELLRARIMYAHLGLFNNFKSTMIHRSELVYCSGTNIRKIEAKKLPEGLKIRDIFRSYVANFFGRTPCIQNLEVSRTANVLRLPAGIEFRIRGLTNLNNSENVVKGMLPVLDSRSLPLQKLSVSVSHAQDPIFQNQILRTSESLKLSSHGFNSSYADVILNLDCKEIDCTGLKMDPADLKVLEETWINTLKLLGFKFLAKCDSEEHTQFECNGMIDNIKCKILAITDSTVLVKYLVPGEKSTQNVVIEVVPSGNLKKLE